MNVHLLSPAFNLRLISEICRGRFDNLQYALGQRPGVRRRQPPRNILFDHFRYSAEAGPEQRLSGSLCVGHHQRAWVFPNRRNNHDIDLLIKFPGRDKTEEINAGVGRQQI